MMKLKKIFFRLTFTLIFLLGFVSPTLAQEKEVIIHLFWANGCPHCAKEKAFLHKLADKYPQIIIKDYEVTSNQANVILLQKIGKELKTDVSSVPFTVIGKDYIAGYYDDATTGKEIEEKVDCAIREGCIDVVSNINQISETPDEKEISAIPQALNIPVFGTIP